MKNFDYYVKANELSNLLEREGKGEHAYSLIDAMAQGSTFYGYK